ncbi:MAG: VOC family protein [Ardenticatenales bacterium]|nr:VOC family protein [Ardenticatenales bacterium]
MYQTKLGHVHLKVKSLDRAIEFYTRYLSLDLIERVGTQFAFLSTNEMHHELALQEVGPHAPAPPPYGIGLYHIAFEVADQEALALAYHALTEAGIPISAVDHHISWALYFADPDGNGLEIYWDTRKEPGGAPLWKGETTPLTEERLLGVLTR